MKKLNFKDGQGQSKKKKFACANHPAKYLKQWKETMENWTELKYFISAFA